jgi:hypothetical protein
VHASSEELLRRHRSQHGPQAAAYTAFLLWKLIMSFLKPAFASLLSVLLLSMASCMSMPQKDGTGESRDNAAITSKVKNALFKEPALKGAEINVETQQGVVQLSGIVDSRAEMLRAVEVAGNVDGVTSVSNDIQLK